MSGARSGARRRPRRSDLRRERRRRRVIVTVVVLWLVVLIGGAAALYGPDLLERLGAQDDAVPTAATPSPSSALMTIAVAGVHPTDRQAGATTIVVVGHDPSGGSDTLLFVPSTTVTDIPGHGLDELAKAYTYGGNGLLHATLENLLGLRIDGVAAVTDRGWERLVSAVGGVTVDLDRRVVLRGADGGPVGELPPGEHELEGTQTAWLIATAAPDESELDRLARVRRALEGLLRATAEDGSLLEAFEDGRVTSFRTEADARTVGAAWAGAARASADGRLDAVVLPVNRAGDVGGFRMDRDRAERLLADRFPGGVRTAEELAGRRLRVLNGNGSPGIGQAVAERVVPAGFRIVLTDNADHFDHAVTRVIVHGEEDELIDGARELVRHLGVGTIEVTSTAQSVADLTVIVGHDFLEATAGG